MAGNKVATSKGMALGAALREARTAAGYGNLTRFAELIGKPPATLSRWETGQRLPRPEDVAQILTVLGVTGNRYEDILALSRNADASSWLAVSLPEQRRHLDALLRFERDASKVTTVSPLLVPGWLQTPGYVRAIMTSGGVPVNEIESRIAIRLGRREILRSAELTAYIGQAALVQHVGGRDVLRGQLEFLLEMSGKVDLRVIPFTAGWHPALEGSWYVIQSVQDTTVVYMENRRAALFLHEKADIAIYVAAVDSVRAAALSRQDSVRLVSAEISNLKE
ncbi:MAG: helix-turn-helix transcriptional regulator [Kibdelosporangium sp.]